MKCNPCCSSQRNCYKRNTPLRLRKMLLGLIEHIVGWQQELTFGPKYFFNSLAQLASIRTGGPCHQDAVPCPGQEGHRDWGSPGHWPGACAVSDWRGRQGVHRRRQGECRERRREGAAQGVCRGRGLVSETPISLVLD